MVSHLLRRPSRELLHQWSMPAAPEPGLENYEDRATLPVQRDVNAHLTDLSAAPQILREMAKPPSYRRRLVASQDDSRRKYVTHEVVRGGR